MAQFFEQERTYSDNRPRSNFIFLGYPYTPAIPKADYEGVIADLEKEFPIRFWYFLDELTTDEMMRKVWRAILRSDLAIFDVSDGNPNVAFELGLAIAAQKRCMTLLKVGTKNPLGTADLGYAERAEYDSATTLKAKIREIVLAKSSTLRVVKDLSYDLFDSSRPHTREEIVEATRLLLNDVYTTKSASKAAARKYFFGDERLGLQALTKLRELGVMEVKGVKRGAKWVFAPNWVTHDHEVAGA